MMALEPITREETYLAAAAGQNVETPEPITRKEMFLDAIAKSGGGGGGAFVVNFFTQDLQTCTADKTLDEVCEAVKNDMVVVGNVSLGFDPKAKWVLPCYGGAVDGELKQIDFGKFQINGNGSVQFAYVIYHATNGIKFRTQKYTPDEQTVS